MPADPRILTIDAVRERLKAATPEELVEVLDAMEADLITRRSLAAVHVSRARCSLRTDIEYVRETARGAGR